MRVSTLYPSKWLAAADLNDTDVVVTMDRIQLEEMTEGNEKPVLYFNEFQKGMVINVTNTKTIAGLYGDETDDWQGQQITLFPTYVAFEGKQVECIRVKPKKPKAPAKTKDAKPAKAAAVTNGETEAAENDIPF